jgi:hypothetical protein
MSEMDALVRDVVKGETLFRYAGELTWRILPRVAQELKARLAAEDVSPAERRKAFSTFIELTYNVLHYAEPARGAGEQEEFASRRVAAAIALGREQSSLWIAFANFVSAARAPQLAARLERLRTLACDGARESYRRHVESEASQDPDSKGGGLGLLTVARAASRPLEFALVPEDASSNVRFHLRAFLS